jgi:hypothetical protein
MPPAADELDVEAMLAAAPAPLPAPPAWTRGGLRSTQLRQGCSFADKAAADITAVRIKAMANLRPVQQPMLPPQQARQQSSHRCTDSTGDAKRRRLMSLLHAAHSSCEQRTTAGANAYSNIGRGPLMDAVRPIVGHSGRANRPLTSSAGQRGGDVTAGGTAEVYSDLDESMLPQLPLAKVPQATVAAQLASAASGAPMPQQEQAAQQQQQQQQQREDRANAAAISELGGGVRSRPSERPTDGHRSPSSSPSPPSRPLATITKYLSRIDADDVSLRAQPTMPASCQAAAPSVFRQAGFAGDSLLSRDMLSSAHSTVISMHLLMLCSF